MAQQKQYLRDAEHLDFLAGVLDEYCEQVKKQVAEEGVTEQEKDEKRARVRRVRLLQRNVRYNRDEVRKREFKGDDAIQDEF